VSTASAAPPEVFVQALVPKARSLSERLSVGGSSGADEEAWRAAIDPLAPGLLELRKTFRDFSPADESWVPAAVDIIDFLSCGREKPQRDAEQDAAALPGADIPFGPVWSALTEHELARLKGACAAAVPEAPLAPQAWRDIGRDLLRNLCGASAYCLAAEFAVFRGLEGAELSGFDPDSDAAFRAFVHRFLAEDFRAFFEEYPALLRVMAVLLENWRRNAALFVSRLAEDWPELAKIFAASDMFRRISRAEFGVSDPHEGGKTVALLELDGGGRFLYKPKPLAAEAWFCAYLDRLDAAGFVSGLGRLRVLDRGGYGYCAFARRADFTEEAQVRKYFRSGGELLFHMYLLGASDLHHENIVATAAGPYPIDLETLCCPRPRLGEGAFDAANLAQHRFFFESVVRTALLPRYEFLGGGRILESSGLAGGSAEESGEALRWEFANRDRMRVAKVRVRIESSANKPLLNGRPVAAADFLDDIESGFAAAYRQALRPEFRRAVSAALESLENLPTRFILRNTRVYAHMLQKSLEPAALKDGAAQGFVFEPLWRALSGVEDEKERQSLGLSAVEEIRALSCRDVPVFKTAPGHDYASCGGRRILVMNEAPLDLVRKRLAALDEADLARQSRFLRASFFTPKAAPAKLVPGGEAGAAEDFNPDVMQDFVLNLADDLLESALTTAGDEAWWLSMCYDERSRNWQYGPVGGRLFDGALGIALFLAAAHKLGKNPRTRGVALATARLVARDSRRYGMERLTRGMGLGIGTGAASLSYGLSAIGRILGEESLIAEAAQLAAALSPKYLSSEDARRTDLLGGIPGALLALDALPGAPPTDLAGELDRRREEIGNEFLAASRSLFNDIASGRAQRPELGFAHGAAGAAYVCARMSKRGGPWAEISRDLAELCASSYDAEAGNWPDWRDFGQGDKPRFVLSWCGGAAGVGLGLLETGRILGLDFSRAARWAAAAVERYADEPAVDHLCCGEAGAALFLARAARALSDEALTRQARHKIARVVSRARRGALRLGFDGGPPNPGFFQGQAGVGYAAARFLLDDLPEVEAFA